MTKWESLENNYIKKGIKILPIIPNKKIPMIEKWNEDCSSDRLQILYWYESNHDMNFAIPCYENNLFVIDLDRHDPEKDGVDNFNKLINSLVEVIIDSSSYINLISSLGNSSSSSRMVNSLF